MILHKERLVKCANPECGHTFCKVCAEGDKSGHEGCPECGNFHTVEVDEEG